MIQKHKVQPSMASNSEYVIGLDVGGTKLLGILMNRSADILIRQQASTPKGNEAVKNSILCLLEEILASARADGIEPAGISIGAPGFVDECRGIMLEAENLEVKNLLLIPSIQDALQIPICLFHDVRSATVGEAYYGAGIGRRDFAFLNLGTGVAVGLYLDGKIYAGAGNKAGEIGHTAGRAVGAGKPCNLEDRLEMLVSGPALVTRAVEALTHDSHSLIYELARRSMAQITPRIIQEAASQKDALAIQLIEETADYLGMAIGWLLDILNLECVVIGGGVAQMGDLLLEPVNRSVAKYAIETAPVLTSPLGVNAGAIGAAASYFSMGG
jgi:glucokinase